MSEDRRLDLTFAARGLTGQVAVRMHPNEDPVATGHDLLAPDFEAESFRGFPVVIAKVTYPAAGPRAMFYWLQTVTQLRGDGMGHSEVDAIHGPFYAFGHNPTFMDAPANPHHPDMDWVARTFLVQAPRIIASDVLDRVVGLTWGYRIEGGHPVRLHPPKPASVEDWAHLTTTYQAAYPGLELREQSSGLL